MTFSINVVNEEYITEYLISLCLVLITTNKLKFFQYEQEIENIPEQCACNIEITDIKNASLQRLIGR